MYKRTKKKGGAGGGGKDGFDLDTTTYKLHVSKSDS